MNKWKQRKAAARLNATNKRLNRGRASGATNKKTKHQEALKDQGITNTFSLFKGTVRPSK